MIQWRRARLGLVVPAFVSVLGCGDPTSEPDAARPSALAPTASSKPTAPDQSLTTEEYLRLGMAAPDRDWRGSEFKSAADVLEGIARTNARQLPRYGSPQSGDVFARMIVLDNLAFYGNRSIPVALRMPDIGMAMDGTNRIFKIYLEALAEAQVRARDFLEIAGYMLSVEATGLEVAEEFERTLSKDEPTYATRINGINRMKEGVAGVVAASLTMATDKSCPVDDRLSLVGSLQREVPRILPRLSATQRLEIVTSVERMAADQANAELRPALAELAAAVK
jgi:hypothetical protein